MQRLQSKYRWAIYAVALLTLLGLIGMHGLPDAMASPGGASAMQDSAHMSSPRAAPAPAHAGEHASASASTLPVDQPARAGARVGQLAPTRSQSADRSVAVPTGCPMDHSNCVAVLRDAGNLTPAVAVLAAVAVTAVRPVSAPVTSPANGPRAPPDVSLLGLGISRT